MYALSKRLFLLRPASGTRLRRLDLAGVDELQTRTSFFRFVLDEGHQHPWCCIENFAVKARFLRHHFTRLFSRTFGASGHVGDC